MIDPNDVWTVTTPAGREIVVVIERSSDKADLITIYDADIFQAMVADMVGWGASE